MIVERSIYISKFLDQGEDEYGNPIVKYDVPYSLNCVLNSLSGSYDIVAFGDRIKNMAKTFLDYDEWIGKINEGDKAYLYGALPDGEVVNGENANYQIVAVLPQNLKIQIYFERLPVQKNV